MSTFSERLRELRDEKKIPQRLMARDLQITPPTLSHWECGYQEPSFKDLIRLSKYFDVSIDYLLGLENDYGARVPTDHLVPLGDVYSSEERNLIMQYRSLPEQLKKLVHQQLDVFCAPEELLHKTDKKA